MPATAARIGFITQAVRNATAGPDSGVASKYGDLARDTKDALECFFDEVDDAETMAVERLALLSADRRRFAIEIAGTDTGAALLFDQVTPVAQVIDTEKNANLAAAVVEIGIDYDSDTTSLTLWG